MSCLPPFFIEISFVVHWSDGMRCCRSDWPGLCLFCCYQPLCVIIQQSWFGFFFCFINFLILLPPGGLCSATAGYNLVWSVWICVWHGEGGRHMYAFNTCTCMYSLIPSPQTQPNPGSNTSPTATVKHSVFSTPSTAQTSSSPWNSRPRALLSLLVGDGGSLSIEKDNLLSLEKIIIHMKLRDNDYLYSLLVLGGGGEQCWEYWFIFLLSLPPECLFLCVVSQQSLFGFFFCFNKFPSFTPPPSGEHGLVLVARDIQEELKKENELSVGGGGF